LGDGQPDLEQFVAVDNSSTVKGKLVFFGSMSNKLNFGGGAITGSTDDLYLAKLAP
jgi:hypothetical protein